MTNVIDKNDHLLVKHNIAKKLKLENFPEVEDDLHSHIKDFSNFRVDKILNNNTKNKIVCLQGTFSNVVGTGLVIFEKTAFEEEKLQSNNEYFSSNSHLKKIFHNDIYGNYEYFPSIELNSIKTTIIHPASEKLIEKYSVQNPYIVDETPDIYESIILPYIVCEQLDLQWVYNILEHKSETDRIVFEDPDPVNGFILLPDLKWNGTTIDTLYLLAIVNVKNIKSLRDLKGEHICLLKNIYNKGCKTIEDKYGITKSQLRIYLHYQPSFYHLHIHFTYLKHESPGILVERAHLLSNVIANLELLPEYYQKITLSFVIKESDKLFKILEENNILKKSNISK